ncbi:MAG: hypothetical protein ACJ70S_04850 [Nitrososphaera sp.]
MGSSERAEAVGSIIPPHPLLSKRGLRYQSELKVKRITDVIILLYMDSREYDQLDALSSSPSMEISQLGVIIKNLKERIESLERDQTELMDKINALEREKTS